MNRKIVIALPMLWIAAGPAPAHEVSDARLVTVTGTGEVRVVPDEVVLTVGVSTLDKDITKSSTGNDARAKKVIEIARAHGVADKDVHTTYVTIQKQYEYGPNQEQKFVGYATQQNISVLLRDIAKYEPIVKGLLEGAIDQIAGIEWRSSRVKELRADARRLAVQAAREKARALAETLGQSIGPAYAIREDAYHSDSNVSNVSFNSGVADSMDFHETPALAPGELSISARIEVAFELQLPKTGQ